MPVRLPVAFNSYRSYYNQFQEITAKPRAKAYTMISLSLLLISLLGWFAVRPTLQTILFLRREIEDKTELNQRIDAKIANLIQAQADYNVVRPQLGLLGKAIPEKSEPMFLLAQLRAIAAENNITLNSISLNDIPLTNEPEKKTLPPESPEDSLPSENSNVTTSNQTGTAPGTPETFKLNLNFSGKYDRVRAAIGAIVNLRRITTVNSLTLQPDIEANLGSSGSGTPLQVNLQLLAYFEGVLGIPHEN